MISKIYLDNKIIKEIKNSYNNNSNQIALYEFFEKYFLGSLKLKLKKSKRKRGYIPNLYSYNLINNLYIKRFFNNTEFVRMLEKIIDRKIKNIGIEIKEFSWKDYTLLNDKIKKKKETCFYLFINEDSWKKEFGGNLFFKSKKNSFVLSPRENTLYLVDKQKEYLDFVQYVNCLAKGKKIILIKGSLN